MGEELEKDIENIENRIIKVIAKIKKDRHKACYQSIQTFLNRNEPQLEMENLKKVLDDLEKKNLIKNKGKRNFESFSILEENLDSTSCEDAEKQHGDDETLKSLTSFIDDKLYEVLINNIKLEVQNVIDSKLSALKEVNELNRDKISEPAENVNEVLVKSFNDEISFLRKEIESKDVIIKMLLDERCLITKHTVEKESKIDNTLTFNKKNISPAVETNINSYNNDINNSSHKNISKTIELIEVNDNQFHEVKPRKRNSNKRQITVLGDSLVKNIQPHKVKKCMKPTDKIYVKSFPGASTMDMKDHSKPSQRYQPDLFILHTGSNDLRSTKSPEEISDEIINLAMELKTDENEVVVSGIICRDDDLNGKGLKVNDFLKIKSSRYALGFINNTNIRIEKHLNGSGLHLNNLGTAALANNFLKIINI